MAMNIDILYIYIYTYTLYHICIYIYIRNYIDIFYRMVLMAHDSKTPKDMWFEQTQVTLEYMRYNHHL